MNKFVFDCPACLAKEFKTNASLLECAMCGYHRPVERLTVNRHRFNDLPEWMRSSTSWALTELREAFLDLMAEIAKASGIVWIVEKSGLTLNSWIEKRL